MCEAEDHKGVGAGDKAFDAKMLMGAMDQKSCEYGNIVIFGGLVGTQMCEVEEHKGMEQATQLLLLNANGCSQLEELPSMETWPNMVQAEGCLKLKSI